MVEGAEVASHLLNQGTLVDPVVAEGASIRGGQLSGRVTNLGQLDSVELGGGSEVVGGRLSGTVTGQRDRPATLDSVEVAAGSRLSNVVVRGDSRVAEGVALGEGVRFERSELIPPAADLTAALPSIGGVEGGDSSVPDLRHDVVEGAEESGGILADVNRLPLFSDSGLVLEQESQGGNLQLRMGRSLAVLRPTSVHQSSGQADGAVSGNEDGSFTVTTGSGRTIAMQPTPLAPAAFEADLGTLGAPAPRRGEGAQLVIDLGGVEVVVTPDLFAEPVDEPDAAPGIDAQPHPEVGGVSLFRHRTASGGQLYQQTIHPAVTNPAGVRGLLAPLSDSGEVVVGSNGMITLSIGGESHRALADYLVESGPASGSGAVEFDFIDDLNGDGVPDLVLTHPDGRRQHLYYIPSVAGDEG